MHSSHVTNGQVPRTRTMISANVRRLVSEDKRKHTGVRSRRITAFPGAFVPGMRKVMGRIAPARGIIAMSAPGHTVPPMPSRCVKRYAKRGNSNSIDAKAIREAVTWPAMRFVPIKSDNSVNR